MHSFYTDNELNKLGLKSYGENVLISRKASIYGASHIELGNNIRIDDFCILSGKIKLNNYIHIAAYTALYGGEAGIVIEDFANLSSRISVYSISDDYSGETMTNPLIPNQYKAITSLPVLIGKHVIIGSTSVILPGVTIAEGRSFGAFSLINKSTNPWTIYAGIPVKKISPRSKHLLNLEHQFKENNEKNRE